MASTIPHEWREPHITIEDILEMQWLLRCRIAKAILRSGDNGLVRSEQAAAIEAELRDLGFAAVVESG